MSGQTWDEQGQILRIVHEKKMQSLQACHGMPGFFWSLLCTADENSWELTDVEE